MITVKLYGLLRIESGIKELHVEASTIKDVKNQLNMRGISQQDLNSCIVLVNEKSVGKRVILHDGDVVQLLSPVAGG